MCFFFAPPQYIHPRRNPPQLGNHFTEMLKHIFAFACASLLSVASGAPLEAPSGAAAGEESDIPAQWAVPNSDHDYVRREEMIPMRDGVKLKTVILIPKGAHGLPMLLERTPYNADRFLENDSPHLHDAVWRALREWVDDKYIVIQQDIRGKYGSEGAYVMTRPPIGPLNATKTDDSTDAWDTIDWLVNNIGESNKLVGMIGSSYDGWTVAMALLNPHPALRVAAPESPMIDGWMGDDWSHYGAFRQNSLDYLVSQTSKKESGKKVTRTVFDDYQGFLEMGSAGAWAEKNGLAQLGFWRRLSSHPDYDGFWQNQALDKIIATKPSNVPTMWLQGLWDEEDIYGAVHTWEALRSVKGMPANNHLVIGPWYHSQINGSADRLGPFKWNGDTSTDFRKAVLVPFFDTYLKGKRPAESLPPVMIYNAVENHWDKFADWPGTTLLKPLYLQAGEGLGFQASVSGEDSYVSDPAKPVPYLAPPMSFNDHSRTSTWLLQDQRPLTTRTDVLSYQTPVLTGALILQGTPIADIFARTTGTDGDFVVKIIDVYPPVVAEQPEMGGYQLAVSMDIFRGRYRESFEHPSAIPAGKVQEYKFRLPPVNYVFKTGHRIMVQIQSSLFPLYDRNPQNYVSNIFFAKPSDYRKATISVTYGSIGASAVLLPVVEASKAMK